jgi:low temperature requirement protein LtrA
MLSHFKAAADRRGRLARELSYLLIPMVAGIIVCAVESELVLAHPGDEPDGAELLTLGAGPALCLVGSVIYKMRVFGGLWRIRAIAVALVVGAKAIGSALPALATWTLTFAILAGVAVAERVVRQPRFG